MNCKHLIYTLFVLFGLSQTCFAQIPQILSYQGVLMDSTGETVADGQYQLLVNIFTQESSGQSFYNEAHIIHSQEGVFDISIGKTNLLNLPFDKSYWLELEIEGEVLTPRTQLTASAHSLNSVNIADSIVTATRISSGYTVRNLNGLADDVHISAGTNVSIASQSNELVINAAGGGNTSPWKMTGTDIYHPEGKVGIGTNSPEEVLDVRGNLLLPSAIGNGFAGVIISDNERYCYGLSGPGPTNTGSFFIGSSAGNFQMTGHSNIGIGVSALQGVTNAFRCIAVGSAALQVNSTGTSNIAIGEFALTANTTGYSNVSIGAQSLRDLTIGNNNVAVGVGALSGNPTESINVAAGFGVVSAGEQNSVLGSGSRVLASNSTAIGFETEVASDQTIRLGNDAITLLETKGGISAKRFSGETLLLKKNNQGRTGEIYKNRSIGELIKLALPIKAQLGMDVIRFKAPANSPNTFQFIEFQQGSDVKFRVNGDGNVFSDGTYTGPADFAEMMAVSTGAGSIEPGDVLVIDSQNPHAVKKARILRSSQVAGIYSTRPGFVGSERDWDKPVGDKATTYSIADMAAEFNEIPMAIVGIVPCKASAENGAIRPGDLLVTSSTPGHAMRDSNAKNGTVLGKALGALSTGTGTIKVLVKLQ